MEKVVAVCMEHWTEFVSIKTNECHNAGNQIYSNFEICGIPTNVLNDQSDLSKIKGQNFLICIEDIEKFCGNSNTVEVFLKKIFRRKSGCFVYSFNEIERVNGGIIGETDVIIFDGDA